MAHGMPLDQLRTTIRRIEGTGGHYGRAVARIHDAIDAHLPWGGLPFKALHEFAGPASSLAAAAFAKGFLARKGALVWCLDDATRRRRGEPFIDGLEDFGIAAERLILVQAREQGELLWAFEEALRCPGVALGIAEIDWLDLGVSRRLQLAAESGGGAGLILRGRAIDPSPNASLTRFFAEPAGCPEGSGWTRMIRLDLWRAKGASPATWSLRWNDATLAFDLVAQMADRTDGPEPSPFRRQGDRSERTLGADRAGSRCAAAHRLQ